MEEIYRRAALTAIASVPVVAHVDVDSLSDIEADLLTLAARDFSGTKTSVDDKTLRTRWEGVDPSRYPTFDPDDEPVKILRSLETRGLAEMRETYSVLSNGQKVDDYFVATDRGRAALVAHVAKATR